MRLFFPKLACKELSELAHQILYSLAKLWVLWVVFFFECLGELGYVARGVGADGTNAREGLQVCGSLMPEKACKSAAARCAPRAHMATRTHRNPPPQRVPMN